MFCYKCGKRLPVRVVNCPECDTPQKRRQRYRRRMILGLFIFLAGAIAGSIFDTLFFKGKSWEYSFLGAFSSNDLIKKDLVVNGDKPVNIADLATSTEIVNEQKAAEPPLDLNLPAVSSESAELASSSEHFIPADEVGVASEAAVDRDEKAEDTVENSEENNESQLEAPLVNEGKLKFVSCEPLEKSPENNYHGSFSRDGSELIFSSNRLEKKEKGFYQCFVRKMSSSEKAERLFAWDGNVWTPELTPDKAKVVFSSDSNKPEHIFVYERSNGKSSALTSGKSKNMMPAISPDGRLIAFVSNRKGTNNIWLMEIDGTNLLQLTTGKEDDREPRWAYDGRSLIFTRIYQPLKKSDIMRIQLDPMGEPQEIISNNKRNWLADISPDGSVLAYVRSDSNDGSQNTMVLRNMRDGSETVINPLGKVECFRPVWKADCSGFVFHASVDSSRNLYFALFSREPVK